MVGGIDYINNFIVSFLCYEPNLNIALCTPEWKVTWHSEHMYSFFVYQLKIKHKFGKGSVGKVLATHA